MTSTKTITINGREYDAATGLPVATKPTAAPAVTPAPKAAAVKRPATPKTARMAQPAAAASVHASGPKRSQTLRRTAVKKPEAPTKVVKRPKPSTTRHMDIARSTQVTKFAAHPEAAVKPVAKPSAAAHATLKAAARPAKPTTDIAAKTHPLARRAVSKAAPKPSKAVKPVTAKDVKNAEVAKAIAAKKPTQTKAEKSSAKKTTKKNAPSSLWKKRTIILTAVAIVALLAVVAATHIFPGLSVQVASIQSGVKASYPKYVPDGYSLAQPIRTSDGSIAITFKSNSNDTEYILTQSQSSWDPSAVLDNLVKKEANNNYVTTLERGLTIYTYNTHAAWVNADTLYTITGNAELSGDQIRKIATSL